MKRQTADALRREAELNEQLESLRQRCRQLESAAADSDGAVESQQYEALRSERDELAAELEEARDRSRELQQRLEEAGQGDGDDSELKRSYEMAMDDVRELNKKVADLKKELAAAKKSGSSGAHSIDGGALNWEAQKAKILAALENESDDDPNAVQERMKIEEVVKKTDNMLADKEAEIQELQRLLEDQSNNLGSVAVGAAALGQMLDQDEIIREERENLKRLQQQWEEKLRKAEIDLSVERAKIARERAELEERLRGAKGTDESSDVDEGSSRGGRWLARLGLKDEGR